MWVFSWVDYTKKYGFAFRLSGGSTGVHFNDKTKIVVNSTDPSSFHYIDRKSTMNGKVEVLLKHLFTNTPPEIEKKVTLLNHFKGFFSEKKIVKSRLGSDGDPQLESEPVYIKKLTKTSHALIMRLNIGNTQACFKDGTEILYQEKNKRVTYIDKESVVSNLALNDVLSLSKESELRKRFDYLIDVINRSEDT